MNEKKYGEADQDDSGYPGDGVGESSIRMIHHQLLVINEQKHEDEDKGKYHPIDHL